MVSGVGCSGVTIRSPFEPSAGEIEAGQVENLLRDSAASGALCNELRGQFLPIAAEGTWAPGTEPSAGRWHVRDCRVTFREGQIALRLSGEGWTWVERTQAGFRVQEYVGFRAEADLVGSIDRVYDEDARLATVWLAPSSGTDVKLVATGPVERRSDNVATQIIGWLGSATPQAEARRAAADEGARAFQRTLARGVTLTVDGARAFEIDATVGMLPRGVRPVRPLSAPGPWEVNERQFLGPGGMHVTGPIDPGSYVIDSQMESGSGVSAQAVCVESFTGEGSAIERGPAPSSAVLKEGSLPPGLSRVAVQAPCSFYVVTHKQGLGASMVSVLVAGAI